MKFAEHYIKCHRNIADTAKSMKITQKEAWTLFGQLADDERRYGLNNLQIHEKVAKAVADLIPKLAEEAEAGDIGAASLLTRLYGITGTLEIQVRMVDSDNSRKIQIDINPREWRASISGDPIHMPSVEYAQNKMREEGENLRHRSCWNGCALARVQQNYRGTATASDSATASGGNANHEKPNDSEFRPPVKRSPSNYLKRSIGKSDLPESTAGDTKHD